MLIDVDIAEGRVWIRYADYFARPLRLTPAEGLGLLARGRTLLATPAPTPTGPWPGGWPSWPGPSAWASTRRRDLVGPGARGGDRRRCGRRRPCPARSRSSTTPSDATSGPDGVVDPSTVFSAAGQWYVSA